MDLRYLMSSLSTLATAIYNKLLTSSYNPTVSVTESVDLSKDMQSGTPRIYMELIYADSDSYQDQRDLQWNMQFMIYGYLKKTILDGTTFTQYTIEDIVASYDFAMDTAALILSLLDDKQEGTFVCPGFIMFSGQIEIVADFEILPGISMFALKVIPIIKQSDTTE
jgi:hypothetical protein